MPIDLRGIKQVFRGSSRPTLEIDQFSIKDGEHIALLGRSGLGKSTLLNLIAGIITPTEGKVMINSTVVNELSEAARDRFRAKTIGYVFQTFNLLQSYTALENVSLAMHFAGTLRSNPSHPETLLERVGLKSKMHLRPAALSVGQQQRVAIARAIANSPAILLADEPTANLDERASEAALSLLLELAEESHRILLLVTHEADIAARLPKSLNLSSLLSTAALIEHE